MTTPPELTALRATIDDVDAQIVALLRLVIDEVVGRHHRTAQQQAAR